MEVIKLKMSPMKWYSQFLEQSTSLITFPFIWKKSEPRFWENQENSIPPSKSAPTVQAGYSLSDDVLVCIYCNWHLLKLNYVWSFLVLSSSGMKTLSLVSLSFAMK